MTVSPAVQQPPQFHGCMNCGPATTHLYCCLHAWPGIIHHNYSFVSQEFTCSTPRRTFPYECDMAAGASSDEFLLQITRAKTNKSKNLARPSPIPHAQEKNKPFGLSPLTLILLGLWAPRANPYPILEAWAQKGPQDWPTWAQKGGHFRAQKCQN